MTVKYVDDFEFPNSGRTYVKGYSRGGRREPMAEGGKACMAGGGIVSAPKAGMRTPRPGNAVKAERAAETLAVRPARGPRIGAHIGVSKPPRAPAPKSMGALQQTSAPMIPPKKYAQGGKVNDQGYGPNATGDENNNGRSFRQGSRNDEAMPKSRSQTDPDAGMFEKGVAAAAMRKPRKGVEKYDFSEKERLTPSEMDDRAAMQAQNMRRQTDGFAKGGRLTAAKRNALPKSDFGLPSQGKYPMPDRSHAANAKARASQMAAKGQLSPSAKARIDAKANRILGK